MKVTKIIRSASAPVWVHGLKGGVREEKRIKREQQEQW